MKKSISLVLSIILVFIFVFLAIGSGSTDEETLINDDVKITEQIDMQSEETSAEIINDSFKIVAGEAGDYGKLITFNKGTEFEETFFAYYIPEGTYIVTNKGDYMSQINVYSNEIEITEEGWEEPATVGFVKVLDVNQSCVITVTSNQHIEIAEPSVFEITPQ